MPLNFDTKMSFATHGLHGLDNLLSNEKSNDEKLLEELKLALIGNDDLKIRLLQDKSFCDWFIGHLRKCTQAFCKCDITANRLWLENPAIPEFPATTHESRPQSSTPSESGALEPGFAATDSALCGLQDALIVLRLLIARKVYPSESKISLEPSTSFSTLDMCVLVLVNFLTHINKEVFPKLAGIEASWKCLRIWAFLSPVLEDTVHALMRFAERSFLTLPDPALDTLWGFLSQLLMLFAKTEKASELSAPLVLKALKLLPLLLMLDSTKRSNQDLKKARTFLIQNIRHLELQLDRLFAFYLSDSSNGNLTRSPILPPQITDMYLLQNGMEFRIASSMTIAIAQIFNFTNDADVLQPNTPEYEFITSDKFDQYLQILLHTQDSLVLNVAALNLFQYRLLNLLPSSSSESDQACLFFKRLFPRIVELLNYDSLVIRQIPANLLLPITVLSDLCLKYPSFCTLLKNTGVDKHIMEDLDRLIQSSSVLDFLQMAKKSFRDKKGIIDFLGVKEQDGGLKNEVLSAQKSQIRLISNHLLLLSVLTSSNEEFRRRITSFVSEGENKSEPNFLCLTIFEIVENYDFMCTQIVLNYKIFWKLQNIPPSESSRKLLAWLTENVSVLLTLLDHPMNTNTFYLIRSLSRSVSTLRTFFVDCNSIRSSFRITDIMGVHEPVSKSEQKPKNVISDISARYDRDATSIKKGNLISCLLRIVGRMTMIDQVVEFFISNKSELNVEQRLTRKALYERKILTFAILANFILDFSSFRHEIVNDDKVLKNLAALFKTSITNRDHCEKSTNRTEDAKEVSFEQLKVQIGILQVIKNYLYNETEENRRIIWDFFPLSLVFELSLYGISVRAESDSELHELRLQQKIVAFEILRNLTAASPYFSEAIDGLYMEFATQGVNDGHIPCTWNKFIMENLYSCDLFLLIGAMGSELEKRFLEDDEFVLQLFYGTEYSKLLVAINYLEDHRYTNISCLKFSHFPKTSLIKVWKRLLSVKLLNAIETKLCGLDVNEIVRLSNQLNEVKISISWILINLTWNDDIPGYHASENSSHHLMNIIQTPENSVFHSSHPSEHNNSFSIQNLVEEESQSASFVRDSKDSTSGNEISLKDRARFLYKAGFCEVLENLINDLSEPKPSIKGERYFSIERFDAINTNDLYEKCKTAQSQIIALNLAFTGTAADRHPNLRSQMISHILRRHANTANLHDSARTPEDVRREEILGHGSDERCNHERATVTREEDRMISEDEGGQEPMGEDEDFEEYWLH